MSCFIIVLICLKKRRTLFQTALMETNKISIKKKEEKKEE